MVDGADASDGEMLHQYRVTVLSLDVEGLTATLFILNT